VDVSAYGHDCPHIDFVGMFIDSCKLNRKERMLLDFCCDLQEEQWKNHQEK
jgi:hypothetical protein